MNWCGGESMGVVRLNTINGDNFQSRQLMERHNVRRTAYTRRDQLSVIAGLTMYA